MPYLTLDRAVLPPPMPALLGIAMVLGLWWTAGRLEARLWPRTRLLQHILCFGTVAAAIGGLVHVSIVFFPTPVGVYRAGGLMLAATGLFQLLEWARHLDGRAMVRRLGALSRSDKAAVLILLLIGFGLLLAALGPPTDADSLDYHLGIPLEWLRQGRAVARPDWLTGRGVGLGEALNFLGLAAGTDCFGAMRQAAAVPIAVAAVTLWAPDRPQRILGALLVMAVPGLLFLVPNQKPQLLPAVLLVAGLIAVVDAGDALDLRTLATAGACLGYAMASKYSFLLTGTVAWLAIFFLARRQRKLGWAIGIAAATFVLLPGQVYLRNWLFYGDPLSPMLERFMPHPDPAVVGYATYLREYGGKPTLGHILRLPLDLVVTTHPGAASTVLGIGVFGFVAALRCRGKPRVLLLCALGACVLTVSAGQIASRFFLEPYLWAAAAAVAAPWGRWLSALRWGLMVQGAAVAVMAVAGAAFLFPGALTPSARRHTMEKYALGYSQAEWMDRVLPQNAVVIAETRAYAVVPRPFVSTHAFLYLPGGKARTQRLERLVREHPINAVVAQYPRDPNLGVLEACAVGSYGPPATFQHAARNPFNRHVFVRFRAFPVDLNGRRCIFPESRSSTGAAEN